MYKYKSQLIKVGMQIQVANPIMFDHNYQYSQYAGCIGTVRDLCGDPSQMTLDDNWMITVEMPDGMYMNMDLGDIELMASNAGSMYPTPAQNITPLYKIDDYVRVASFSYGQGSVELHDIGKVVDFKQISDTEIQYVVNIPGKDSQFFAAEIDLSTSSEYEYENQIILRRNIKLLEQTHMAYGDKVRINQKIMHSLFAEDPYINGKEATVSQIDINEGKVWVDITDSETGGVQRTDVLFENLVWLEQVSYESTDGTITMADGTGSIAVDSNGSSISLTNPNNDNLPKAKVTKKTANVKIDEEDIKIDAKKSDFPKVKVEQ